MGAADCSSLFCIISFCPVDSVEPHASERVFQRKKIGPPGRIGRGRGLSRAGHHAPTQITGICTTTPPSAPPRTVRNQNYQMGYIDPKLVEGAAALVESFTCAICFNLFEKPRTACSKGHTFCADCLTIVPMILFYR